MSALPDHRSDRTPASVLRAREVKRQILSGKGPVILPPADPDEPVSEDTPQQAQLEDEAPAQGYRHDKWWQYMPSEAQLFEFLGVWLRRNKQQALTVTLQIPLDSSPGNFIELVVPVYYALRNQVHILLMVDPAQSNIRLPNAFQLSLRFSEPVAGLEQTVEETTYLGTFLPLPNAPVAVMSFLHEPK